MTYLVDVVREVINGDDEAALDAAVARSYEDLFDDICTAYEARTPQAIPRKQPGEFVPGWRIDVANVMNPYGGDPYFVFRALLYSHRVAIADPLKFYVTPPLGFPRLPSPTLKADLHKILIYGPFEEAGLLVYVDPNLTAAPREGVFNPFTQAELETFFRDYLAVRGSYRPVTDWSIDSVDARLARHAAEVELTHGLRGIAELLDWQRLYRDHLDLYVPEIPIFRDSMEWLMRGSGKSVLGVTRKEADQAALSALWSLPTLNPEAYSKITTREMINLRQERPFELWRDTLQAASRAHALGDAISGSSGAVKSFMSEVQSRRDSVLNMTTRLRYFRDMRGSSGKFGLSLFLGTLGTYVSTAAFPGENAFAAALGGAGGFVAPYAPTVIQEARKLAAIPAGNEALTMHFDIFATGS